VAGGWHDFVTEDDEEIVKKCDRLRAEVGIKVTTLPQAVDLALAETERQNQPPDPATRHFQAENDRTGLWSHSGRQTSRSGLHISERPRCFGCMTKREGATQRTGSDW
jgi:hypothetical protein